MQGVDALDLPNCGINHGFCYSLYVRDPNGMLVEFTADAPNELELSEAAAASAHHRVKPTRKNPRKAL